MSFIVTVSCYSCVASVIREWMQSFCGVAITGKPKYLEKTLSQCYFVYHKSHTEWPGIAPGPAWSEVCD